MAEKDRYIGISMGLDIEDLRTGLKNATTEIKLADSEFKKNTAGLGDWTKSAQGVAEKLVALSTKVSENERIVESYRKELQRVRDAYGEDSAKAKELQTKLNDAEKDLRKAQSDYESLADKLEDLSDADALAAQGASNLQSSIGRLTEHIDAQKTAIDGTKSKLEQVKSEYGEASPEAESLTKKLELQEGQLDILESTLGTYKTALDKCETETGQLDSSTEGLTSELGKADSAASSMSSNGLSKLQRSMENLRDKVFNEITGKVKELATATLNLGIDFTSTMSEVQAISGATKEDMEKLSQTARDFGATTTFSATESAEALKYMALAGWDTNQSTAALGGVLDLAAASSMDLGKASDMVTDNITAFGLEAQDAGKFADMLAYAQSHANTTVEGLGEAYKNSAATMAASGQTAETTTAILSKMADAGLKGSNAGTALSAVMRDLTKKMQDGSIQIGETAVSVTDADGNFRSLSDILIDVESAVDGMGTAEKATALQTTFTSDSIKGLNLILGQGAQNVKAFEGELAKSDGTAKNMAETMNDNLGGDIKKLKSAFEELQLKLFDMLEGPLRGIVNFVIENLPLVITLVGGVAGAFAAWKVGSVLKEMVTGFKAMIPVLTALTSGTALSTAAEVAHTAATTAMTAAQGLATAATTALSGAMSFLAGNPIVLVIAAIAAIVVALKLLWDNCEEFRDAVKAIWEAICGFFEWAAGAIADAWDGIVQFFEGVWNGIQEAFAGVGQFFDDIGKGAVMFFEDPWAGIQNFFGGVWDNVKGVFGGVAEFFGINSDEAIQAIEQAWSIIVDFYGGIWNGIQDAFGGMVDFFGGIGESAAKLFQDPWGTITGFFGGVWESICGVFAPVKSFFEGIYNSIIGVFKPITDFFAGLFGKSASTEGSGGSGAAGAMTSPFTGVVGFFNGIWEGIKKVFEPLVSFFGTLASGAVKLLEDPWGSVTSFFTGIWNGITGVFSGVGDFFGNVFGGAVNGIKNAFNGIKSFFEGIWNGIVGFFKPILSIFGINLDSSGGDPNQAIKDKIAEAEKSKTLAQKSLTVKQGVWEEARRTYGYGSQQERLAYSQYDKAFADYGQASRTLNDLQSQLKQAESKTSGGGGVVGDMTKSIKDGLTSGLSGIGDIITKPFQTAWNTVTNLFGGIGDWFSNNVMKPVGDAVGGIAKAGGEIIGGLSKGIGDAAGGVVNTVKGVGESIFNGITSFFGIHSPSRLMRDKVGKMVGEGIALGISDSIPYTTSAVRSLGSQASNALRMDSVRGSYGPTTVVYNQTINSPEPLSVGQIYRDTRSLMARKVGQ